MMPRLNGYITVDPTPKQLAFLRIYDREAFYGGAAGPGKSAALLMAALQFVDQPGYRALLLRKTLPELALPGALIEMSHEWLDDTDAVWEEGKKRWLFPSGAILQFGYLEYESHLKRYKGSAFHFIGFDELTEFSQKEYTFMAARCRRRTGETIPLRIRAASNPGGPGHDWVKAWFISDNRDPQRWFIPGRLEDNPYLDREPYVASLRAILSPVMLKRVLDGDWDVRDEGGMFKREWLEDNIIDVLPSEHERMIRYWDLAATEEKKRGKKKDPDWTAGGLFTKAGPDFIVVDMRRIRKDPAAVDRLRLATAKEDVGLFGPDYEIHEEQEPGGSGSKVVRQARIFFAGFTYVPDKKDVNKEIRARPLCTYAEGGNVKLLRGVWNKEYLDELEAFPNPNVHDDQVDSTSGAFHAYFSEGTGIVDYYRQLAEEKKKQEAKEKAQG